MADAAQEVKEEAQQTTDPGDMTEEALDKALTGDETHAETETKTESTAETKTEKQEVPLTPEQESEKLRKQITDKQTFIDRQAREIGDRRQRETALLAEIQAHKEALKSVWQTEPLQALEIQKTIMAKEGELQNSQVEGHVSLNKQAVAAHVQDFDGSLPDIAKMLMEDDKLPKDIVDNFLKNPYATESTGTLVALAKRAETRKLLTAKDTEIATLKAEIGKLQKKPDEVVRRIEQAARQTQTITAKTGRSTSEKEPIDESQIAEMSDDDIEMALKEGAGGE